MAGPSLIPESEAKRQLESVGAWVAYADRKRKLRVYHDGSYLGTLAVIVATLRYKGVDADDHKRLMTVIGKRNLRGRSI
jgi:hypothetical protein